MRARSFISTSSAWVASAFTAAAALATGAVLNALLPPPTPSNPTVGVGQGSQAASPTYSVTAQGNHIRLRSPIPVAYGTAIVYPDFATKPYAEYVGNDQYLHQLLVVSQGTADISDVRFDDSPITSFNGTSYQVIHPGGSGSLFNVNTLPASEVGGQYMKQNVWLGPFPACPTGTTTSSIHIDITLPNGLYYTVPGTSNLHNSSAVFDIQVRQINDQGAALGGWTSLGSHIILSLTPHSTPIRQTFKYSVAQGRYEVRVRRTNTERVGTAQEKMHWAGLRAVISPGLSFPNMTLLAVRIKATDQIAGQTNRRINCKVARKIKTWDAASGWSGLTASKSVIWSLVDALKDTTYGGGLSDDRLDLPALKALDSELTARGDTFSGVIDQQSTLFDAVQKIARAGRCLVFLQSGRVRVVRDKPATAPVMMLTPRRIVRDSLSLSMGLWHEGRAKEIEAEYFDTSKRQMNHVTTAAQSGLTTGRTARIRYFGIDNLAQATREAKFEHASTLYRRSHLVIDTEMEALILSPGDLIAITLPFEGYGQWAALVAWEASTRTMTLDANITKTLSSPRIAFTNADGSITGPINATKTGDFTWQLASTPATTPRDASATGEPSQVTVGSTTDWMVNAKVLAIIPKDGLRWTIKAFIDDTRVYTADGTTG